MTQLGPSILHKTKLNSNRQKVESINRTVRRLLPILKTVEAEDIWQFTSEITILVNQSSNSVNPISEIPQLAK